MEKPLLDLRVMVDATVLISGVVWPRWSYDVLQQALQGRYQLVLCQYVIDQARRRMSKKFPEYLDLFEELLREAKYEIVDTPSDDQIEQNRTLVRDITDVPVALAAINARVDYLVSEDKDLSAKDETTLELRKHLKVMIAGTFLREVMLWQSDELDSTRERSWMDLDSET
jgi:predicted nucleic acid-binding protein